MVKPQKLCSLALFPWAMVAASRVLCVAGCGPRDAASLSGKVTFDGQPVANGSIRLLPKEGTTGHGGGAAIVNGSYEIPASVGLVAGDYSVVISATREATAEEAAKMGDGEERPEAEEGEADKGDAAPKVQLIPAKYNLKTTLTVQVSTGVNTKDFDLEK